MADRVAITGAFSYSGKYITQRLLDRGYQITTLTSHPDPAHLFAKQLTIAPLQFNQPEQLQLHLHGVRTLINTYWIRFDYRTLTFDQAVENTTILFKAALNAGVERIIHISITNPTLDSPLPYFKGKAELERFIQESVPHYSIVRPTVIFGSEDILINNIAYLIRRFPFFVLPGDGSYRLQPIYVEDMADLVVEEVQAQRNGTIDAVGPDQFTFEQLIRLIAYVLNRKIGILHAPPGLAHFLSRIIGMLVRDQLLTADEVSGLMGNLLISTAPTTGSTRLQSWLESNQDQIGKQYHNELKRHFHPPAQSTTQSIS